jgi:guanylate kinase
VVDTVRLKTGEEMNNNLMVISGPSGSGKSTLIRMLLKQHPGLLFSVSHTTRSKRKGEKEGKDYYFVTKEDFIKMIDGDQFLEWAEVHMNYYGTSWREIQAKSKRDEILILDIDIQGASNLKSRFPGAWYVFVVPPSMNELEKRLINRQGEGLSSENQKRLARAKDELDQYVMYDFLVVNDDKDRAFSDLNCIYMAFCQRSDFKKDLVLNMIGGQE